MKANWDNVQISIAGKVIDTTSVTVSGDITSINMIMPRIDVLRSLKKQGFKLNYALDYSKPCSISYPETFNHPDKALTEMLKHVSMDEWEKA